MTDSLDGPHRPKRPRSMADDPVDIHDPALARGGHDDAGDIHDPALARSLKGAFSDQRAPEEWVREALLIPGCHAIRSADAGRVEPLLVSILPHLCGLALLLGLSLVLLFHEGLRSALLSVFSSRPGQATEMSSSLTPMILSSAVAFFLIVEGARGFPVVRKWMS